MKTSGLGKLAPRCGGDQHGPVRWSLRIALGASLVAGLLGAARPARALGLPAVVSEKMEGTSVDPALQAAAERILKSAGPHEGAIVASDPRTGRILAWASVGGRDFVREAFAPSASLFKLVTASALLEGGKANANTRECYDGGEHDVRPSDLEHRGAVCTSMGEALGHSVNLVFAKLAKKHLQPQDLRKYARELGFSGDVPIDVGSSKSTINIPDDPFGMARASAGFWNGKLSPLGALFAVQTIANDGERIRLSLGHGGGRVSAGRAMSVASARSLTRMLEITTRRGTAAKAFRHADGTLALPGISVAAKTGTLIGGKPSRMYSWFAGFAPSNKPEIALAVMLGNDLVWRAKANLVGRELLEAYFHTDSGKVAQHGAGKTRAKASAAPARSR